MRRVSRRNLLGFRVLDCHGEEIGQVVDTWPDDGGWEVELVVIRLQRFGERRMLPAEEVVAWGGVLRVPYSRTQIEDAPIVEGGIHRVEDPWRALAYWRFEEHGKTAIVTPPWRRSSGFFVTERPSPTSPSPTTTAN
jgi:sporulation protein YlmC with PRC-barrel domain